MIADTHRIARILCGIAYARTGVRPPFHEAERVTRLYREHCFRRTGETRTVVAERLYETLRTEIGWPAETPDRSADE